MQRAPTIKGALTQVMWAAMTPAFIMVERNYGISWPVTWITGAALWISVVLIAIGAIVVNQVLRKGDNIDVCVSYNQMCDATTAYSPVTRVVSMALTLTIAVVLSVTGHRVLGFLGYVMLILSNYILVVQSQISKRFFAMSWEERAACARFLDEQQVWKAQLTARVRAVAESKS